MARVLQIRRGTTAQNDNFTGLVGELTFDTDKKVLRVHDGVKLGGYEMAAATDTGASGGDDDSNFDISDVPDEFWRELFAQYGADAPTVMDSILMPIKNKSFLEYIFDTSDTARGAQAFLVCQTPQAGYSVGDMVAAFGIGDRPNPAPNTFSDGDGLHVRLMIGQQKFWVSHKTTGATTNITNENWRAMFRVYC